MTRFLVPAMLCIMAACACLLAGCGGGQTAVDLPGGQAVPETQLQPDQQGLPAGLPQDGVQPWETVGPDGFVVRGDRSSSSITFDAEFVNGVDYFSEGGSTSNVGGVLALDSGNAGSGDTSYAVYRVVLGGETPGTLGLDINLRNRSNNSASSYYVGLADYAQDSWEWHGPFADGQVRLGMNDGMLSTLGNAFVAVVAHDGADFDVVGVGIDIADGGDTTAPPAPGTPTLTPVDGGLLLEWLPVIAGDIAGYNVYFSSFPFVDKYTTGAKYVGYIEGSTRHALTGLSGKTYVLITAVDISGNESGVSPLVSGEPLAGTAPDLEVTVDKAVGQLGDSFSLTASGADEYDFDLDGDGIYEITGQGSGSQVFSVDGSGIVRPAVRGTSGTGVALGAVSLIVSGNARPVARLYVDPAQGIAPFAVSFTSEGEDFDGSIDEYAWDFNGDGIYDESNATGSLSAKVYSIPGLFNAKLRVTDDKGASDVDTVAINARQFIGFNTYLADADQHDEIRISSAIVDGNPAVVYFDTDQPSLQYRRSLDSEGRNWGPPTIIAAAPDFGDFPALAVISGRPAIAWWAPNTSDVRYLYADDAQGSSWSMTPVVVDAGPLGVSWRISMTEVAGNPALAYSNGNNAFYRRASGTAGTGATAGEWVDPVATIVNTGFVGGPPELAVINGNPAIAHYNWDTGSIDYKRAVTATGALVGDWPAGSINCTPAGFSPAPYCNLLEVNGNPAISFPDGVSQAMAFMRALDADGTSWPAGAVQVNPTSNMPNWNDMRIIRGRPAIVYQGFNPFVSVWYVRANDSNGSGWGANIEVRNDTFSNPGEFVQLLVSDGQPIVTYRRFSPNAIEIGIPAVE